MPRVEMRECGVTYVVMEGLCLAGVLARLPSVWSGAIQIPEHAGMERGEMGSGEVKGLASGTKGANVQQLFITNGRTLAICVAPLKQLSCT